MLPCIGWTDADNSPQKRGQNDQGIRTQNVLLVILLVVGIANGASLVA